MPTYAVGDLLLLVFGCSRGATGYTVTDPAGWTPLFSVDFTGSNIDKYRGYWKVADGSEGTTVTITTTQACGHSDVIFDITGYSGTPEVSVVATATSNAPNSGNLTPSWGAKDTLWISTIGVETAVTVNAYPTNYASNQYAPATSLGLGISTFNLNAASQDPGAYGLSASKLWQAFTIGIQPVGPKASGNMLMMFD